MGPRAPLVWMWGDTGHWGVGWGKKREVVAHRGSYLGRSWEGEVHLVQTLVVRLDQEKRDSHAVGDKILVVLQGLVVDRTQVVANWDSLHTVHIDCSHRGQGASHWELRAGRQEGEPILQGLVDCSLR